MAIVSKDLTYKMHEYSDFELAFLLKNRHENLNELSKQNLVYEIKQRGLSPAQLTDLIEGKLAYSGSYGVGACRRCSSEKLLYPEVANKKGERKYYVCEVCGEHNFREAMERNNKKSVAIVALLAGLIMLIGAIVAFFASAG
ncbi:MAG: hypothetical protein C0592_09140 [Marinilabiliales bacterium]|nr:MAG: hypothetical protein C0592_09140 [Marinilabiliales bacterium]